MVYSQDTPAVSWANVAFETRVFDPADWSLETIYKIHAITEVENYTDGTGVFVDSEHSGRVSMSFDGPWSEAGIGFIKNFVKPENANLAEWITSWEGTSYRFFLGDSVSSGVTIRSPDSFNIEFGYTVPVFESNGQVWWDEVDGANRYRVRIYELSSNGGPNGPMIYDSGNLYDTGHSFPKGLPAADYAYVVEARNFDGNGGGFWVERSMYFTKVSVLLNMGETYHFRANRSMNSLGWTTGDKLSFGAVNASLTPETNISVSQGDYRIDTVDFSDNVIDHKVDYTPELSGIWELTATNEDGNITAATPDRSGVPLMPFAVNVRLGGTPQTPAIAWDVPDAPAGYEPDRVRIQIFDDITDTRVLATSPESITNSSFTLPLNRLQFNHPYVMRIMIAATENDEIKAPPSGIITRSELFVNFTLRSEGWPGEVFLPVVGEDPDPGDEYGPPFHFNIEVVPFQPYPMDPDIAVGYDYAVGEGNPLFASVILPYIGDNLYELYLFDGVNYSLAEPTLAAGNIYDFVPPVDRFRILGIETEANLDPNDALAFVTVLTFDRAGLFTGTMTPIIRYVPDNVTLEVPVDIKPNSCSNPINARSNGVLPVAILGTEDFDVNEIDPKSVRLEGIPSKGSKLKDVATPDQLEENGCNDFGPDGYTDLTLKFKNQEIIKALGDVSLGEVLTLELSGNLKDGTPFAGEDVVVITKVKPQGHKDDNKNENDGDNKGKGKNKKHD